MRTAQAAADAQRLSFGLGSCAVGRHLRTSANSFQDAPM